MKRENRANGNRGTREGRGREGERERERERGMKSEYDISYCAERVGLVSLRLHTKSRIVLERCSESVFSIDCLMKKKNSATSWINKIPQ